MEFDRHAAFSHPSRPCRLDRALSWTGTPKIESQYSSNGTHGYDYGRSQTLEFYNVSSLVEDALRQFTSSPWFPYSGDSSQINDLPGSYPATQDNVMRNESQNVGSPQGISSVVGMDIYQQFYDATPSLEPQEDFSSYLWSTLVSDNHISTSPLHSFEQPTESDNESPGMPRYRSDHSAHISAIVYQDHRLGTATLETIDEEINYTGPNIEYQQVEQADPEGTMWSELYGSQFLSSMPFQSMEHVLGQNPVPWQPLQITSLDDVFHQPQTQVTPISEAFDVPVKVDVEILVHSGEPVTASPMFTDLMSRFESNPAALLPNHRRRRFTEAGRSKVKQVRINGACISCKARKVPCTPEGACDACIKLACRSPLADHICVRDKLKDTYIGVRALHGSSFDNRKARLTVLLSALTGQPQPVQFSVESYEAHDSVPFRNNDHHIRTLASLDIQVMQCSSSSLCRWKRVTKRLGIYVTSDIFEGQRYVIVPSSLPSIDEFDRFGRKVLLESEDGHSGRITLLLDQFLNNYCSRAHNTAAHGIASLTAKIASLNNLVAYGFLNLRDGSFDLLEQSHIGTNSSQKYISETVHDQIRLLAAEGLEPAEKIVFGELDNINKHISGNKHARIIIGICLLRLMLLYRDRLVRDNIRLSLPKRKKWHQYRLEKASFMYRRLTVTYGTLCRDYDTPLTMEWEDEEDAKTIGEQWTLRDLYLQLQPAFHAFCQEKLSLQYDDVLQILLANPAKLRKSKKRRKTHH